MGMTSSINMQSLGKIVQHAPAVGAKTWCLYVFLQAGCREAAGKLPVLNLLTGQKSGFSPCRGDSLHRFTSNFAGPTGTWVVYLCCAKFHLNHHGGGNAAPKYQKFILFGRVTPLTDFENFR